MRFSVRLYGSLIIVVFLLFSCSESKKNVETSPRVKVPQIGKPIIITICALKDHSLEVALKLLRESDFEKNNNILVKTVLLEFEAMSRAHEMELSAGKGTFDLVSIDQPSLGKYVGNAWVQALDPFIADRDLPSLDLDDLIPVLRQSCGEWQEKFYAVPLGSYGALLAYRQDILQAAGLQPPKTFADLKKMAVTLNSPPNLYATALFAHLGEYITADSAPFLWSWGAGLINGCDVTLKDQGMYRAAWASEQGIAALEFYASLYRDGLTHPNTLNFDHARYIEAFRSGKVIMGIMPAEGIGAPMDDPEKSLVVGKISYANLPGKLQDDGSFSPPHPGLGAHSLAISQNSKHPKESFQVLQFLTSLKMGPEYIRLGGRPFRNSHFSKEALAQYPHLKPMKEGMETGRCRPNIPEYPAVSKIFYTALHSAILHNASVSEVMKAAAQKANEEVLIPAYPEKPVFSPK